MAHNGNRSSYTSRRMNFMTHSWIDWACLIDSWLPISSLSFRRTSPVLAGYGAYQGQLLWWCCTGSDLAVNVSIIYRVITLPSLLCSICSPLRPPLCITSLFPRSLCPLCPLKGIFWVLLKWGCVKYLWVVSVLPSVHSGQSALSLELLKQVLKHMPD